VVVERAVVQKEREEQKWEEGVLEKEDHHWM
jgi:hypothetical protein